ncbi:winged helix-turn-helix transcriptional regulator [Rhizobium sp. CF142]|uniref:winged helix-turn-helix transcriptional regulator n=1 Tax=Rhizobium sp. CF142 TaxID=1144314 RepID=UPI00026EEF41|nr:helix-turn-helix domain-containing protein [Rhizobium sp. CF142]EJJ28427.1 putative transcriptional regulator [Rhizobium sp. CF142]
MDVTARPTAADCRGVSEILSRVGDKWTIQVVVVLRRDAQRFNGLKRQVSGISQQMLTRTLKTLERDGMIARTVRPSTPPQVEYTLTPLGHSLSETVRHLADWAAENRQNIEDNRLRYDTGREEEVQRDASLGRPPRH